MERQCVLSIASVVYVVKKIIMSIYVLHLISDEGISLSRSANAYTEAS